MSTSVGRLGLAICSDLNDPTIRQTLSGSDVNLVVVSQAVAAPRPVGHLVRRWEARSDRTLMAPMAATLGKPMAVAGLVGPAPELPWWAGRFLRGGTQILDRNGRVLSQVFFPGTGIATADVAIGT